jgi:hypothetical protein
MKPLDSTDLASPSLSAYGTVFDLVLELASLLLAKACGHCKFRLRFCALQGIQAGSVETERLFLMVDDWRDTSLRDRMPGFLPLLCIPKWMCPDSLSHSLHALPEQKVVSRKYWRNAWLPNAGQRYCAELTGSGQRPFAIVDTFLFPDASSPRFESSTLLVLIADILLDIVKPVTMLESSRQLPLLLPYDSRPKSGPLPLPEWFV